MKIGTSLRICTPICVAALLVTGCASTDPTTRVAFPGVTINHHEAHLLLDTGSDSSWLESGGAARLGVKTNLAVPDVPINGKQTEAIALSGPLPVTAGNESFAAQLPIDTAPWFIRWFLTDDFDGLIGWPEVRDNILVFDPERRTINGVDRLPPETADWLKVGVGPTDVLTLDIPLLDGRTGRVLVDTGDPMGVGLSPERWRRWQTNHPHAPTTKRYYTMPGIGMVEREEAWADEIRLGTLTLTDLPVYELPEAMVSEFSSLDATFGMYALSRMDLVVDARNHSAYLHLKPPPGPPYPGVKRPGVSPEVAKGKGASLDWMVADGVSLRHDSFLVLGARYKVFGKDFDGAMADCGQALELNPQNTQAYVIRGSARDGKDDYEGAVADFNRALELDPKNFAARFARAQTELAHEGYAAAMADFDHVLEREPQNTEARAGRAESRQVQGDYAGALADFGEAMLLNQDSSNYFRLYSHLLQMRVGSAPDDFTNTVARWKKGWVKSLGRFVTGTMDEKALLVAATKSDEEPVTGQKCEAYYFIGMMRLLKGDQAGAREFWEKCVATEQKDYYEYNFARGELARLKAAK